MLVIKTEYEGQLLIGILFESQDDVESLRAFFGGSNIKEQIDRSNTPTAPKNSAIEFVPKMTAILNPLSKLL